MNRRSFLKAAAASFIIPQLIIPEHKVWALDSTMLNLPPARGIRDDTAWLQWHIDNGTEIPRGKYFITSELIVSDTSKGIIAMDSQILLSGCHDRDSITVDFKRDPNERDMFEGNYGWSWEALPDYIQPLY